VHGGQHHEGEWGGTVAGLSAALRIGAGKENLYHGRNGMGIFAYK